MKIEKEHRRIVSLCICIGLFAILVIGSAFAVLQNISYNTENVTASLGSRPVFSSTATNSIAMNNIPFINEESNKEYEIANATDTLSVSLSTGYNVTSSCKYDIIWEWDEVSSGGYVKTTGAKKEFQVSGTSTSGKSFREVQLNDYDSSNRRTVLKSQAIIVSENGALATETWTITTHFYKTQAIQTGHQGKAYAGKVIIDNVTCVNGIATSDERSYWYYMGEEFAIGEMPDPEYVFDTREELFEDYYDYNGVEPLTYVISTENQHYVCLYIEEYETEMCLTQPYTEYTNGLTYDDGWSDELNTSYVLEFQDYISQAFRDIGIDESDLDKMGSYVEYRNYGVHSYAFGLDMYNEDNGTISAAFSDYHTNKVCQINENGSVYCGIF